MSRVERTLIHTFVYAAGLILNRGLAFLLLPVYIHVLSPTEIALWDVCAVTVLFLVPIFQMGLPPALMRFYHDTENEEERARTLSTTYTFAFIVWLIGGAVLIVLASPLSGLVLGDSNHAALIVITVLIALATTAGNQPLAILRAKEQSVLFSLVNLARAVVAPAAIIVLVVFLGHGVRGILWGEFIGLMVVALTGLYLQRDYLRPTLHIPTIRRALAYGLPLIPMAVASTVTIMSDRYFLVRIIGQEDMAVYTIAFRIAMVMGVVVRAFQTGWQASALILAKEENAPEVFARFFRWFMAGMLLLAIGIGALAPEILALIAPGGDYADGYRIVPWVTLSYAFYGAVVYTLVMLLITNRTGFATLIFVCGAILKIALNFVLIEALLDRFDGTAVWAGVGAALATVAAYLAELLLTFYITRKLYPVPYAFLRLTALFTVAVAATAAIVYAGAITEWWSLLIRLLIVALVAALLPLLGIIPVNEWHDVQKSVLKKTERIRTRFRRGS